MVIVAVDEPPAECLAQCAADRRLTGTGGTDQDDDHPRSIARTESRNHESHENGVRVFVVPGPRPAVRQRASRRPIGTDTPAATRTPTGITSRTIPCTSARSA